MYKWAHLLCITTYHMLAFLSLELAYHSLLQPPVHRPSSRPRKATRPKRRPLEKAPKSDIYSGKWPFIVDFPNL